MNSLVSDPNIAHKIVNVNRILDLIREAWSSHYFLSDNLDLRPRSSYLYNNENALNFSARLRLFGFDETKLANGAFRLTYFHTSGKWVLKVPLVPELADVTGSTDVKFLSEVPEKYINYFPNTILLGDGVLLQRSHPESSIRYERYFGDSWYDYCECTKAQQKHRDWLDTLIEDLELIDVHEGNIGWSGNRPKIIDFSQDNDPQWDMLDTAWSKYLSSHKKV